MEYSPLSQSAAYAVASNGIDILKMPKYADQIAKTIIHKGRNGWLTIYWIEKNERIIHEEKYRLIREEDISKYPMIGTVERTEA